MRATSGKLSRMETHHTWTLDTRFQTPDSRLWTCQNTLKIPTSSQNTRNSPQDSFACWIPDIGLWTPDSGHWALDSGRWDPDLWTYRNMGR